MKFVARGWTCYVLPENCSGRSDGETIPLHDTLAAARRCQRANAGGDPFPRPMKVARRRVMHSGLITPETLDLLQHDPVGCRQGFREVGKILRLARAGVPSLLERARRADLALHMWETEDIPGGISASRVVIQYWGGLRAARSPQDYHVEGRLTVQLTRHTPSWLTVRRVRWVDAPCWDCSRENFLFQLTLLDFMENLHLEETRRRDHALIVRLMQQRLAWAARVVGEKP